MGIHKGRIDKGQQHLERLALLLGSRETAVVTREQIAKACGVTQAKSGTVNEFICAMQAVDAAHGAFGIHVSRGRVELFRVRSHKGYDEYCEGKGL